MFEYINLLRVYILIADLGYVLLIIQKIIIDLRP